MKVGHPRLPKHRALTQKGYADDVNSSPIAFVFQAGETVRLSLALNSSPLTAAPLPNIQLCCCPL
jgi:hypothetical protein